MLKRIIISLFLWSVATSLSAALPLYTIRDGVLDLRDWNPEKTPMFRVKGEAEFYWQSLIIQDGMSKVSRDWIHFPGAWNLKGDYPYHGFASVRFHVLLPPVDAISIQWPWVWTAVETYINGELVQKSGVVGRDAPSSAAGKVAGWDSDKAIERNHPEWDIVLQMSNFDLFLGGITDSQLIFGTRQAIENEKTLHLAIDAFILGAIFITAMYHGVLFLLRRQDLSTLYFGLFCLMIGLHLSVSTNSRILSMIFDLDFRGQILVYNYSWMSSVPIFTLFMRSLFPKEFSAHATRILIWICLVLCLFIGLTEVRTFIFCTQFYQFIALAAILYTFFVIIRANLLKREGAKTLLIAICILFAGAINDMLLIRGLLPSVPVSPACLFLFIFGQSYLLSVRFSHAFHRAEVSETRVRKLADDLEVRIEEQTRDIRSFMEHTPVAIFAIEGPDSTIHRDYSLHLEHVLEQRKLAGQQALPLLFKNSNLSNDEYDQITQALNAMIGEDELSFDLNRGQLPRSFRKQNHEYEIAWKPIVNERGMIDKILVALSDLTEVKQLQHTAQERADELQSISEIISIGDDVFRRFIRSCDNFNDQNAKLLEFADPNQADRETVKVIFMNMHTMKGSARTLRLKKIANVFHDLESYYAELMKQGQHQWDIPLMKQHVETIDVCLREYETIAIDKLGRKKADSTLVALPIEAATETFHEMHGAAMRQELHPAFQKLYGAMQNALYLSIEDLMEDIFTEVPRLAKDLEKPAPHVSFDLPSIFISQRSEELLRNTFVHLVRNCLDHGIEPAAERRSRGKEAIGSILLSGRVEKKNVLLILQDDGRGLNLPRLLKLSMDRGLIKPGMTSDPLTCADAIFHEGLSTASTVTTLSGRGMGMAAVRRYLEDAGGSIQVKFTRSVTLADQEAPFELHIELPLTSYLKTPNLQLQAPA